jgi:hypothetical protein
MDVAVGNAERFYRLDGVLFRVRTDRPDQGAHYLRGGVWVWTPITSGSVIHNPHARPLSDSEAAKFRTVVI